MAVVIAMLRDTEDTACTSYSQEGSETLRYLTRRRSMQYFRTTPERDRTWTRFQDDANELA